jgi:VanZ family protein
MSRLESAEKTPANWRRGIVIAALVCYWVALFVSTHVPLEPQISVPGEDKTLHFVGYGVLALLFGIAFPRSLRLALIVLALYAAFDELTQPLVGRHCDFHDWLADLGGIAIGLTLVAGMSRWMLRRDCSRGRGEAPGCVNSAVQTQSSD